MAVEVFNCLQLSITYLLSASITYTNTKEYEKEDKIASSERRKTEANFNSYCVYLRFLWTN